MLKKTVALLLALVLGFSMFGMPVSATTANVTLMTLTRTASNAAATGNAFAADGGVFAAVSSLTAWNNNEQINIGYLGTARAPMVLNNSAVNNNTANGNGWRSVGSGAFDAGITVDTATAFQIRFSTDGYENIRFSARQRSTGSGPQFFALAYSIGSPTGPFTPIANSSTGNVQSPNTHRNNAYTDFDHPSANTFTNFHLPAAVNDHPVVYLRVYMINSTLPSTLEGRYNGNTSINDIVIVGDVLGTAAAVDRTALEAVVAAALLRQETNYSATSWGRFDTALTAAQAVMANAFATQGEVDFAATALTNAMATLLPAVVDTGAWGFPSIHLFAENEPFDMERQTWHDGFATVPGEFEDVDVRIRGRGWSTWYYRWAREKRPLRLRFEDPHRPLFSEHAHRQWILLANHRDRSLLRYYAALDFARNMEPAMQYVPMAQNVHLYVNGTYRGVYMVTDERDLGPGRMDLTFDPDPALSEFFLEFCLRVTYQGGIENDTYVTVNRRTYDIRFPTSSNQRIAHAAHLQDFLYQVSEAMRYSCFDRLSYLICVESFVDFYLVVELFNNNSIHYSSTFMSVIQRDGRQVLQMGPVWDYDSSYFAGTRSSVLQRNGFFQARRNRNYWFVNLMRHNEFRELVTERWNQLVEDGVPQGTVARVREMAETYGADFQRNHDLFGWRTAHYRSAAELADWIEARANNMTNYFNGNTLRGTWHDDTLLNRIFFWFGFGWIWMRLPSFSWVEVNRTVLRSF